MITTGQPRGQIRVNSPNVVYSDTHITSRYTYANTRVETAADGEVVATPTETTFEFQVERAVPRVG